MISPKLLLAGAAVAAVLAAGSAVRAQDADPAAGAKVFRKCQACHAADKEQNRVGPHLVGIVGRPVASVEDYRYSDAMIAHAEEEPAWTEEALAAYLRAPRSVVPKTKMAFAGLKKDEDVANIIAYLKDPAAAE